MKKWVAIFTFLLATQTPVWQRNLCVKGLPVKQNSRSYFAFNLMPGPNTGLVNFAVVTFYDAAGLKPDVKFVTRDDFLLQAMGKQLSAANPNKENFFINHEIQDCSIISTDNAVRITISCSVADDLWKLKYSEYPVKNRAGKPVSIGGWAANESSPSEGQMSMLKKFGVERVNDFFYGGNAFKLLKSIQDPAWVSEYVDAK